ncbi:MAG: YfhO family protein [Vulcanimicrobiota bacterium]
MRLKGDLLTFLIAALVIALFFAPFFSPLALWGSGTDLVNLYYPIRSFTRNALLQGHWPLWNPYLSLGIPVQTGVRSLSNPLLFATIWLPTALHVKLTLWLHTTLSVTLMALFLKRQGLSRPASLSAGLIYGISGFAIGRIFAGHLDWTEILPHLPIITWTSLNAMRRPGVGWTLVWAGSLALLTISGHYQAVYMAGLSLFCFHLMLVLGGSRYRVPALEWWRVFASATECRPQCADLDLLAPSLGWSQKRRDLLNVLLRWGLAGTVALGLSAFQLIPAWETLSNSNRVSNPQAFGAGSQSALYWLTSLLPRFFDGKIVLLWWSPWPNSEGQVYLGIASLALVALCLTRCRHQLWLPLAGVALLAIWLSLGPGYGLHDLMSGIDPVVYRNFRGACRWGVIYAFYGAWLAGLGVDQLSRGRTWTALVFPGIPLLATVLWLLNAVSHPQAWTEFVVSLNPQQKDLLLDPRGESPALILQRAFRECGWSLGLCLATWALGLLPRSRRAWAAFGLIALDLAVLLRPYLVMVPVAGLELPAAVASRLAAQPAGSRVMWNPALDWLDRGMIHGLSEISFYDSAASPGFVKALNLVEQAPIDLPRTLMQPWSNHPLWNVLGVGLIAQNGALPPWAGLEPLEPGLGLFRNPRALARVYMTGRTEWVADADQALRRLVADPEQAAQLSLISGPGPAPSAEHTPEYRIGALDIQPNRVRVEVEQRGDGLLVLSDAFWPGWRVFVDGRASTLYSVHGGLQRGVWLTSGRHAVEFSYWPASLTWGLLISGLCGGLLGLGLGISLWKARRVPELSDQPSFPEK